jgi:hypothetical protein
MAATDRLQEGIAAIAEGLERRGWSVGLQQDPPAINMHIQTQHSATVDRYLADLADVTRDVAKGLITADGKQAAYN